ncbi:hypothetical protein KKA08_09145, partial [bacterium]|nr:hypothetical protein [bacterium]
MGIDTLLSGVHAILLSTVGLFSGAARYVFGVEVPPGRVGLQPAVRLTYDSHSMEDGLLGLGWSL